MLRYGEIERLCEGLTAYYRPYAKRKQFARIFRDAYERTGIRVFWANIGDLKMVNVGGWSMEIETMSWTAEVLEAHYSSQVAANIYCL